MPLLADYAITPDVFDVTSYSNEEVCGLHLSEIRQVMMNEGLVRDLREGEWRRLFASGDRPWHRWAKEIVRKLATHGRLVDMPAARVDAPTSDQEWCHEALLGHEQDAMTGGVIVTQAVKEAHANEALVEQVDRLSSKAKWWMPHRSSVRVDRKLADFRQNLDPILRCANSLQFVDPHLNPGHRRYSQFADLLVAAGSRTPAPTVEIHRVCYEGSGPNRVIVDYGELEQVFHDHLTVPLQAAGLRTEVFLWDDFHDRYLISNLMGISLPNGFDTTTRPRDLTTWTRLGAADRDDVQREFDEASRRHTLQAKFTLP
ncbi:MAG: hypothetical protein OXG44_12470 [Gammaproteobacteria bacterium]|nr:hypothetical protein [Gammaproteobacteria bacterium]